MILTRAHWRLLPLGFAAVSLAVGIAGIVWTFPEAALTTAFEPPVRWAAPAVDALAPSTSPVGNVSEATPPVLADAVDGATPTAARRRTVAKTVNEPTTPATLPPTSTATDTPAAPTTTPDAPTPQAPRYNPNAQVVSNATPAPKLIVQAQTAAPPTPAPPTPTRPTSTPTPRPTATPAPSTPEARPGNSGSAPGHNKAAPAADVKLNEPKNKKK